MSRPTALLRLTVVLALAGCDPAPSVDAPANDAGRDTGGLDAPVLDAPALDAAGLDAPGLDSPSADVPAVDDAPSGEDARTDGGAADAPDTTVPDVPPDPCDPPAIGPSMLGLESCYVLDGPVTRSRPPGGDFSSIVRALVVTDGAVVLQSGDDTERFLVTTEGGRCVLRRDGDFVSPATTGELVDADADGTLYFTETGGLRYAGARSGLVAGIASARGTRSASRDGVVFLVPPSPGALVRVDTFAGTSSTLSTMGVTHVATFAGDVVLRSADCALERVDAAGDRVWCTDTFDVATQRVVRCGDGLCMKSGSDTNNLFSVDAATGTERPFETFYYAPGRTREVPLTGYDASPDGLTFMSVSATVSPTCAPGPTEYLLHFARATF